MPPVQASSEQKHTARGGKTYEMLAAKGNAVAATASYITHPPPSKRGAGGESSFGRQKN